MTNIKRLQKLKMAFAPLIIIFFTFISVLGCKNDNCGDFGGTWAIDEMQVDKKDFLPYLYVNAISFRCKDFSAHLPSSHFFDLEERAKWSIIADDSIEINSSVKIYNNKFKVSIIKKTPEQLNVILESKDMRISAYKIINDY